MNAVASALLVVFALTPLPGTEDQIDQGFYLFENRHLDKYNLGKSKAIAEEVLRTEPRNERALDLLSRVWMTYGDDATKKADKMGCYEKGKVFAESLLAVNERNPEGHFWFVANYGRIGQTRGVLNSLFMVPRLKKEMLRTLELDLRHAGGHDALGVLYYELPGFAGGDLGKSIDYLKKGAALDPNYTLLHVDLAKSYMKKGLYGPARDALKAALAITKPTHPADHWLDDKPEAERLLLEVEKKLKP